MIQDDELGFIAAKGAGQQGAFILRCRLHRLYRLLVWFAPELRTFCVTASRAGPRLAPGLGPPVRVSCRGGEEDLARVVAQGALVSYRLGYNLRAICH